MDLINHKIIAELEWDANQPLKQLAKKLRISPQMLDYRIKKLEEEEVIIGYYPLISPFYLDLDYVRIGFELKHMNSEIRELIEKHIKKDDRINWSYWFEGKYSLAIACWSKNFGIINSLLNDFEEKFPKNIQNRYISIITKLEIYGDKLIERPKKEFKDKQKHSIDRIDRIILNTLQSKKRKSASMIGREINIPYRTVQNRIKKMKFLLGLRAEIDYSKINKKHKKIIIYVDKEKPDRIKNLKEEIKNYQNTNYFVDFVGTGEIDFEYLADTDKEIHQIIENYSDIVQKFEKWTFVKNIKSNFVPYETKSEQE